MKTIAQQLGIKDFPFDIRDKNGNEIYWEISDGYWVKSEYDSNGNEIYVEASNGYWAKSEFDSNGNEIYLENSNGFWIKWEYDLKNKIYFETSKGDVIDNRPKQSCEGKVVEIDGKKYQLKEV